MALGAHDPSFSPPRQRPSAASSSRPAGLSKPRPKLKSERVYSLESEISVFVEMMYLISASCEALRDDLVVSGQVLSPPSLSRVNKRRGERGARQISLEIYFE